MTDEAGKDTVHLETGTQENEVRFTQEVATLRDPGVTYLVVSTETNVILRSRWRIGNSDSAIDSASKLSM